MKIKGLLILVFALLANIALPQSYKITGRILDAKTNKPLPYASIKVADNNSGTTSDDKGYFILKIKNGSYNLITSYIGYFSDTSSFYVTDSDQDREIFLRPSEISTEVIEVAGEDPAYDIIRKAIMYKRSFKKDLKEYNYNAFTKFVIRSSVNPFGDDKMQKDSSGLSILGILESESTGYVKAPDLEKQIVKSKRETANISRGFALPFIVNFYDENLDLGEVKIPGPLCDNAFDSYEYKLLGTSSIDSTVVFKIKVINTSSINPQFLGNIYIIDSLFALIKVDLETNGKVLKNIEELKFKQKFSTYKDNTKKVFWMPNDVQIFAEGTFAGLLKFKGDAFSIISDYNLNEKAPPGLFDEIIVKVNKDAEKDSSYWKENRLIKNSEEEKDAYKTIGKTTAERENKVRFGGLSLSIGKNLSVSLMDIYKFNSIAGSQIGATVNYSKDFGRINSSLYYGYGFADKKAKYNFNFSTQLLNDRSLRLKASAFNYLNSPFMTRGWDHEMLNTYYTLFTKKERYYYYYLNGFSFDVSKKIIPQIGINAGYFEGKQTSANVNTDYSFFKKNEHFGVNPLINDAFKRSLSLTLTLDFNKYRGIDWGTGEITRFTITDYPTLTLKTENTSKSLGSTYDNRVFSAELNGEHFFTARLRPKYSIGYKFSNGILPYQDLLSFGVFKGTYRMEFAAMDYAEFLGNKMFYINFENNFGKLFPGKIPVLNSINLIGFFNAGRNFLQNYSLPGLNDKNIRTTNGLFLEAGFAIANIFDLARVDFGWRLNNYKQGSNFNMFFTFFN
jgi:hypothetical protein